MKEADRELFDIDTSVMYIIGLSEVLYDFQLLLQLQRCFEEKGYKVAVFTDKEVGENIENVYSLYEYLDPEISVEKLVIANHFMKEVEVNNTYDLFLVGIQKGAVSFGREILEDLGLTVYSMSRIVHPDCVMLQIFWGDYQENDIDKMAMETEQMIGETIDFFHIQNCTVDMNLSLAENEIVPFRIEKELVQSIRNNLEDDRVFLLDSKSEIDELTEAVIIKLQSYAEIERM